MTVYSEENKVRYIGNGVSVDYMVTFPFMANDDGTAQLGVYLGDSDVPLKENIDYTVSGANTSEGGIVTFMTAPAKDEEIAIIRQVPNVQTVIFKNEDKFPAVVYETSLDKLTMMVQELKENINRAIVLPPTSDEKPLEARDEILEASATATASAAAAQASESAAKQSETSVAQMAENFEGQVDEATDDFNANAESRTAAFDANAASKTEAYNANHEAKLAAYNANAAEKQAAVDASAAAAAQSAAAAETALNTAVETIDDAKTEAVNDFNDNAAEKLTAYNSNHAEKLSAYNSNAEEKQAAVDTSAAAAAQSAQEAKQYRDEAQQIANMPLATEEVVGGAKLATEEQALAGTDDSTIITPKKLKIVADVKADAADLTAHTGNQNNPHGVTKAQVGLGNVDNTSDADKPISTAVHTKAAAADLTAHTGNQNNPHGVTKAQVGLGNVDNTADANKPVSTAQKSYVDNFQPAITALSQTSGTVALTVNKIYSMTVSGATTFTLPTPGNVNVFNQIKVMMKVTGTPTINWGTTWFFNKATPEIEAGNYDVYFDYDNLLGAWVCGVLAKGVAE